MENQSKQVAIEEWEPIPGYEGFAEASNLGRIKSCERMIRRSRGGFQKKREAILVPFSGKDGYLTVALSKEGVAKTFTVHRLVMMAFHGISDLVVDHKDGNKKNNRLSNLRYCTQRDNLSAENFKGKSLCGFAGVSMNSEKYTKRYRARIRVQGKLVELGSYHTPQEAGQAYVNYKQSL